MKVFGFGERKTPNPFIAACDKFTYIEIIHNPDRKASSDAGSEAKKENVAVKEHKHGTLPVGDEIIGLISASINDVDDENGWAFLAVVGNLILKKKPDFDPRNFGFAKLTPLIKSLKQFEIEERESGDSKIKHVYVRNQPIRRFE
ncbi:OST-HTH/LOTUS domain-containing protein [Cohnella faecalis]